MLHLILLSLFLSLPLFAEINAPVNVVDFEQNPSHIEWKKIDTENFEIIFPEEISTEAQRVANLLERAYPFVTRSLETRPPKISLVLQNQSVVSNGFVTLAPRRSEWYVTPSVDPELTNTEWLKTLAVHEFRHVVQFQKTRQNFNRYFEFFLGEIGQALGLAFSLPPWFLEGDAVGMETALTDGGRGRLPIFERDLRTLLLSGKDFDFDKAILRSFQDWVPNHYVYGYFLTSLIRNKYGDLFLSKLADQSTVSSWNPLSFYNSSDRMLVGSFEEFYKDSMRELLTQWKEQADKLTPTPYEVRSVEKRKVWTNYHFPQVTSKGKILALKSGLGHINQFVLVDDKKDEVLFYPGVLVNEFPYRLRNDRLAYVELELDPRWGYRDWTTLKVYDLKERKHILSLPQTKLRLPALNHTGEKILGVSWDEEQGQNLVIMDLRGEVIKRLPITESEIVNSLDWLNDDEAVLVLKDQFEGKSLVKISLNDGMLTELTSKSVINYGTVTVSEGQILFESPASGIDNIYLLHAGHAKQITSAKYGAYSPSLHNGKLVYNDYTAEGMNVVEKSVQWDREEASQNSFVPFYEKFAQFEDKNSFAAKLQDQQKFEVSNYSQFKNAINFHSWIILAPPLGNTVTLVGYSRDILNKLILSAGAEYNVNEKTGAGFTTLAWSHYYPVFDLRAAYGNRRQDIAVGDVQVKENKWEEGMLEAGVRVPWSRISGRMIQTFSLRAFGKIIHVTDKKDSDTSELAGGSLFSPGAEMEFSFLSRFAPRDLLPPWGVTFNAHFEEGKEITGQEQKGSILSLDSRLYLPGIIRHHSFYHQLAHEKQRNQNYEYASFIVYPRGTRSIFLMDFVKYSGNYTMPLFYPDWHWSRYIYLKRLSLNLFFDELNGQYRTNHYRAASTGWEMVFDMNVLRLMFPLSWGVRGSYILYGIEKSSNYELFITSTLASF